MCVCVIGKKKASGSGGEGVRVICSFPPTHTIEHSSCLYCILLPIRTVMPIDFVGQETILLPLLLHHRRERKEAIKRHSIELRVKIEGNETAQFNLTTFKLH